MKKTKEFDWNSVEPAIQPQAKIAVFENSDGAVVIRSQGDSGYQEDQWIIVQPHNVQALINALHASMKRTGP